MDGETVEFGIWNLCRYENRLQYPGIRYQQLLLFCSSRLTPHKIIFPYICHKLRSIFIGRNESLINERVRVHTQMLYGVSFYISPVNIRFL